MTNGGKPVSGEDSLIARYFKPLATDPGAFGLVDDAAILKSSGEDIVVTTDALVEGVHYLADDPSDTIARKALRVNLSDLAAKGASPAGFVLTLALRGADDGWLRPFAEALGEDAKSFGCPLLGGEVEGEKYLPAEAAFFRDIVSGVVRDQKKLDPLIDDALSKGWPLKRIEAILRAVLRAGAYELQHRKDVPGRVVVSEYVDVANAFVDREETGMVNAVLDQIGRHFRDDEFGRG